MIKSITLVFAANVTGTQEDLFERHIPDISKSHFCPKIGPCKGWLTIPQENCLVTDFELKSGFSVDFTVGLTTPNGENLKIEMLRPLISRNRNSHPQMHLRAVIEILEGNGWRCQRLAGA